MSRARDFGCIGNGQLVWLHFDYKILETGGLPKQLGDFGKVKTPRDQHFQCAGCYGGVSENSLTTNNAA